jgi:hypothetical protein
LRQQLAERDRQLELKDQHISRLLNAAAAPQHTREGGLYSMWQHRSASSAADNQLSRA